MVRETEKSFQVLERCLAALSARLFRDRLENGSHKSKGDASSGFVDANDRIDPVSVLGFDHKVVGGARAGDLHLIG